MKSLRYFLVAVFLAAPSFALAQPGPFALCVPLYNASTGAVSCVPVGQTSPNITTPNPLPVGGVANAAAPTFTEGRYGYLSFDLSGNLRTTGSGGGGGGAVTIADGADVTEGAIADAASSAGGVGTLSAKLRLMTTQLGTINTTLGTPIQTTGGTVGLVAGVAEIGNVKNSGTFAVQATLSAETTKVIGTVNQGTSPWVISGALTANQSVNVSQINAVTPLMGNGATGTGSQRVTIANDNTLPTGWASSTAANQTATQAPVAPATATATKSDLTGCQATSAAINPTTGQQAAIDCDLNNNLLVSAGGAPNLATTQVSVATSDTSVAAARALRRSITVQQVTGTQQVYCSQTTATSGNGILLPAVVGASFTLSTTSAVRCIALTGAQTVAIAETF